MLHHRDGPTDVSAPMRGSGMEIYELVAAQLSTSESRGVFHTVSRMRTAWATPDPGKLRLAANHPGALTADQRQFYDFAVVLGIGDRQTTIVITKVRWSAIG